MKGERERKVEMIMRDVFCDDDDVRCLKLKDLWIVRILDKGKERKKQKEPYDQEGGRIC